MCGWAVQGHVITGGLQVLLAEIGIMEGEVCGPAWLCARTGLVTPPAALIAGP